MNADEAIAKNGYVRRRPDTIMVPGWLLLIQSPDGVSRFKLGYWDGNLEANARSQAAAYSRLSGLDVLVVPVWSERSA